MNGILNKRISVTFKSTKSCSCQNEQNFEKNFLKNFEKKLRDKS